MKDIVIERIEYYKSDLEKLKDNKLDKAINECEKVIDLILKDINNYDIDKEYEKLLILSCKLENVKNEVDKLNNIITSKLIEDLKIFLKIYD